MKKLKNWLVCLLLAVCCVSFVACGVDKNNVNLNEKPNVAIEGDFQQTEVAQLSTTFGTKEAVAVENFARYQVYISLSMKDYSQTTNMAFELDEEGKLQGMAMKMSLPVEELSGTDATCYYKDGMFYVSMSMGKNSYNYKFDPTKIKVGEDEDINMSQYTDALDKMNIAAMLDRFYSAMENNEYFEFSKTEDNTKFKVETKTDATLPAELECTSLTMEIELSEGKLSQMRCVVTGDTNIEILLTKTDKKIKYPNFNDFMDITDMMGAN